MVAAFWTFAFVVMSAVWAPGARAVTLGPGRDVYERLPAAYHLEASGHPETIDDVLRPGVFPATTEPPFKVPYTDAGVWVRVELEGGRERTSWRLGFDDTTFNTVDLYVTDGRRVLRHARGGSFVPLAERDVPGRRTAFSLELAPEARRVLYLRIASFNIIDPALHLVTEAKAAERDAQETALLAWYYGAVVALLLFNFLLYLSMRDRVYLLYCAFAAATSFTFFSFDGLADLFLGGLTTGWARYTTMIGQLALLTAAAFARSFLSLRRLAPRFDRFMALLVWVNGVAAVVALTPWQVASGYLSDQLVLVNGVMVLTAGVLSLRAGFRPARFYLLSWATLFGSALVWLGMMYGLLPRNALTAHGILVGSVVEMLLVSLGLGDRIKRAAAEREEARQAAREGEAVARAAQMLAHDLRKPYSLLDSLLTALGAEKDPARLASLAERRVPDVREALARVQTMLDELQRVGAPEGLDPTEHDPAALFGTAIRQAAAAVPGGDVALRWQLTSRRRVRVDEGKIVRVLTNLMENALQALGGAGTIWVATREVRRGGQRRLEVAVGNDGPCIPKEELGRLFGVFYTKGKPGGTGLGLATCKRIIEAHGGRIGCVSSERGGTEFRFTLPVGEGDADPALAGSLPRTVRAALGGAGAKPPQHLPLFSTLRVTTDRPTVALLDDCPFIREAWETSVADAAVQSFSSPDAFFDRLDTDPAFRASLAVIVTDFHFGADSPLDGCDVARRVRTACTAPVVLSSDRAPLAGDEATLFSTRIAKRPHSLADLASALGLPG